MTRRAVLPQLARNQRGALMIAGIFMMIITVAMLYVVIGIGKTIQAREGMQDAADASAYAAAVFMARGMNLIALINLLMALLVAVLVVIRLIQTFFQMAAIVLYSFAWLYGSTVAPATACEELAVDLGEVYDEAKEYIFQVLEVMHEVQEGTSVVVPFVAVGAGMLETAQHHPPADGAFALPSPSSLPVESDEFPVLCGHATEMAIEGATSAFTGGVPVARSLFEPVTAPIEAAANEVGQMTSKWLCGDGSSKPPSYKQKVDQSYPKTPGQDECENATDKDAACTQAEGLQELIDIEESTGICNTHCGYDDPYEERSRQARKDCEPVRGRHFKKYSWQEVDVRADMVFHKGKWTEQSHVLLGKPRYKSDTTQPPCGRGGSLNNQEWNHDSGPRDQVEPNFLCSQPHSLPAAGEGEKMQVEYRAALRIFSCTETVHQDVATASQDQALGGDDSEDRSPHRVQEDVEMGSETFQIRALAFGPPAGPGSAMDGVRVSLLGGKPRAADRFVLPILDVVNRFSFAQAEYYFEGNSERDEWLWEMRWRARLVRVRMPSEEETEEEQDREQQASDLVAQKLEKFGGKALNQGFSSLCSAVTDQCPQEEDVDAFASIVIH